MRRLEGYRVAARATAEQFQLFQRYQLVRHGDGDMASMSFYDYRAMVEDTPVETFIIEFRDDQDRLVSPLVWLIKLGDGLSAVYSFFSPGMEKRSLGTHAVLWLIERARGRCDCRMFTLATGCRRAGRWRTKPGSNRARC